MSPLRTRPLARRRTTQVVLGLGGIVGYAGVGLVLLTDPSTGVPSQGFGAALVLLGLVIGIRGARLGIYGRGQQLIVRNQFRTRKVAARDIAAVEVATRRRTYTFDHPRVVLRQGDVVDSDVGLWRSSISRLRVQEWSQIVTEWVAEQRSTGSSSADL